MNRRLPQLANRYLPRWARRAVRFGYLRLRNIARHFDPHYIGGVTIGISRACNRRCSYCPVAKYPRRQALISDADLSLILRRLQEIRWDGVVDFIAYNEPLLHPRLVAIVRQTKAALPRACPVLTTNGDRLTMEMTRTLIDAGITQFNVTRHPPYSQAWDRQISQVRRCYPDHLHFLASPGDERWTNRGGLVTPPGPLQLEHHCVAPEHLVITMEAKVALCCNDFFEENIMGDLHQQTLHQIFYSDRAQTLRKNLRQGRIQLPICRRCLCLEPFVGLPQPRNLADTSIFAESESVVSEESAQLGQQEEEVAVR